jgi:hypothetical protein
MKKGTASAKIPIIIGNILIINKIKPIIAAITSNIGKFVSFMPLALNTTATMEKGITNKYK